MMRLTACSIVLGAGVLGTPLSALAEASGHVTMTQVQFQLIDLDPADGVAPSVTFPVGGRPGFDVAVNLPSVDADAYDPSTAAPRTVVATAPFGAVSTATFVPGASAAASYSGNPRAADGASFDSTASAAGGSLGQIVRALSYAQMSYENGPGSFVLSPHTELIVTAAASGQVSSTAVAGDGQADFAYGTAFLQVSGTSEGPLLDNDALTVDADPFDGLPANVDRTSSLRVSITNTAATSLDGYYFAYVALEAESGTVPPTPPVPEPGSAWLLLAGLAVIAPIRRQLQS